MFKSTKPCLCKETNGSYSNAVIGIAVLSICVIITIGCWGILNSNQDDSYLINCDFSLNVFESQSRNKEFVSVAQGMEYDNLDTDTGAITVGPYMLPDWDNVPLCITEADFNGMFIDLKVTGGYVPTDLCDWYIKIWQDTDNEKDTKECIGRINLIPTLDLALSTCCEAYYHVYFDVVGDCIQVDSNHFPDLIGFPQGWVLDPECEVENLDKFVMITISTEWQGCCYDCQQFEIILSQKIIYFRSPQLP